MTYQTILVNLSDERTAATALDAAVLLAERHTAHLLGLHVKPAMNMPISAEIPASSDLTTFFIEQQRQTEKRIKRIFEQKTETASYVADWRSISADIPDISQVLIDQGNTADLVILAQTDPETATASDRRMIDHVLVGCGRPVYLVPWAHTTSRAAERILVAWDGRRESTRALFGALPMLRHASEARLHRINQPDEDRHHGLGVTEELANTLARHGVRLEVHHSDARTRDIAEELLGFGHDMDAHAMVMGCYGHGRLRERLLGGTTRDVLINTKIPVLMSN